MPSGFRLANGQDLDDVLEPRGSTTAGAATGFKTADGLDLNQRYRASTGGDLTNLTTGYKKSGGADLRQFFRRRAFNPGVAPPQISSISNNSPVAIGGTVLLSIVSTGSGLQYQWYFGNQKISGATASTYSISSATTLHSGQYYCVVSNSGGSMTISTAVSVTVMPSNLPSITSFTNDSPKTIGQTITLTVTATGSGNLSYVWSGPQGLISATGASYSFTASSYYQAGVYTCTVSNEYGHVSANTTVTITNAAPIITSQSYNSPVAVGNVVEMSVTASWPGALSYTWYSPSFGFVGTNSPEYSFTPINDALAGIFYCTVSNGDATAVAMFDIDIGYPPETGSTLEVAGVLAPGNTITLSLDGLIGSGGYSYAWYKNGSLISGATSDTYSFTATGDSDDGTYECVIENTYGSTSASVTIDVNPLVAADIYGSNRVYVGLYGSGYNWTITATATNGLKRVRFQIVGHGSGNWADLVGAPTSFSDTIYWANPMGSPSISTTPGTYLFQFEAEDMSGNTAYDEMYVIVDGSPP